MLDSTLLTIALCVLAADFITGFVHWIEDTYGLPSWPLLGSFVIEPNIEHHLHPGFLGTMSNLALRNYQAVVPMTGISAVALVLCGWKAWPLAATLCMASLGNEVHTWNHRRKNNAVIRFLQNACIVQTPRQHAKHHRPPFDTYFCTLTNVTNELLEAVGFWRRLEWLLFSLFGLTTKRMSAGRSGV